VKPFRERNKTVIGAVGMATLAALLAGAFYIDAIVGGDEYRAEFTEAAGLRPNGPAPTSASRRCSAASSSCSLPRATASSSPARPSR
jgi:hypothetical protein